MKNNLLNYNDFLLEQKRINNESIEQINNAINSAIKPIAANNTFNCYIRDILSDNNIIIEYAKETIFPHNIIRNDDFYLLCKIMQIDATTFEFNVLINSNKVIKKIRQKKGSIENIIKHATTQLTNYIKNSNEI